MSEVQILYRPHSTTKHSILGSKKGLFLAPFSLFCVKVYLLEMRILQHLSDKKINNGQNEKYKKSKKKP